MSLNEQKKEESQMSASELSGAGFRLLNAAKKEKCELLLKEIDAVALKIRACLPKEGASISFEERKRAQESLVPLKEDYSRKRGELFGKLRSVVDRGFQALVNEHLRQVDKTIEPAAAGRTLSPAELIMSELMKTRVARTPASSAPAKTEIKPGDSNSAIPEEVRIDIIERERRMKSIMLEMWKMIDNEITPENFEERRIRIIEKFNAIKIEKKETGDQNGSGDSNG